jgi:peptidoglycan hydrolase-like protein with peptidoglycan-binding domain
MRRAIVVTASLAMAVAGCSMTRPENGMAANAPPPAAPPPAAQMTAPERQALVARDARAEANARERELREAQQTLKAEGFYRGPIDGKSGPRTLAAIEAFQKRYGLKQTGWLDQPTWSALDLYGTGSAHATGAQASAK